ncbi:Aspartyl protease family protein [Vigna angularis]|uniref:Aspartyl protease family protein n=1 Tax=Phaseolus angularis TaxID=3914 RepID=A0A8T0K9Z5_PHAAN|nr:Aspartyl protease family protein [Vigna angularis]
METVVLQRSRNDASSVNHFFRQEFFYVTFKTYTEVDYQNDHTNDPTLTNVESYTKATSSEPTSLNKEEDGVDDISENAHQRSTILRLRRRPMNHGNEPKTLALNLATRDLVRIQTLHRKVTEKKESVSIQQQNSLSNAFIASLESTKDDFSGSIMATLKNISCYDPLCQLVSSPDPLQPCKVENQTCPYFYEYADGSNTTGDFALEKFTVNFTWPNGKEKFKPAVDVMFGCGHWNKGFFHGASGLLGLGRGPVSFFSQLQSIYGHSFSYCLTDLFSNSSTSSKLVFGEDKELLNNHNMNFTSFLAGEETPDDTFYYLQIKSIMVGGERLDIPEQSWHWLSEGAASGGTIIDSGSTLTFFPDPVYGIIKEAFEKNIKLQQVAADDFIMAPCYNVSGALQVELPDFGIHFADGAVWNFPAENYFYQYELDEVICLAIMGSPHHSHFTIIGNLLQQNFHILYDMKRSRLGYSPRRCAEV